MHVHMSWVDMRVSLNVSVQCESICTCMYTNALLSMHVLVLSRIEELEIQVHNANDTINQQKLQFEHQMKELQKR